MLTKRSLLHSFEWHDLPINEIVISCNYLSVVVSPYTESTQAYRTVRLTVSDIEHIHIDINGSLRPKDLTALEVSFLELAEEREDRLSARLGILPGAAGFWTIGFAAPTWQLVELAGDSITSAQRKLIAFLLKRTGDLSEADRRWQHASGAARQYAAASQLLLARDWTADLVLSETGDVWIIDTENGGPSVRANQAQRRSALFRGLYVYPEILPLLPARPATAATCESCEGAGIPEAVFANQQLRNVICACAGAGWTVDPQWRE